MGTSRCLCDECSKSRMEIVAMTLEECSLNAALSHAKRRRDIVLLQCIYEKLESLRKCRTERQRAYRLHRQAHSRPSWAA